MKATIVWGLLFLVGLGAFADPLVLINTLATRPLFTLESSEGVVTRSVAPQNRVSLEPGLFSGLGLKEIRLAGGTTYYLAWLEALPGLYRLPEDQALVLNQSGRAVDFSFLGTQARSLMAAGSLALGQSTTEAPLTASWDDGSGIRQSAVLKGGTVYRLTLDSPEGLGTSVSLKPWD